MFRRASLTLIPLLLAAGGIAIWGTTPPADESSGTRRGSPSSDATAPRIRERDPELEAAHRLRSLVHTPPDRAPDFATVDRWAGDLGDQELRRMIEAAGFDEPSDLHGWLRCALYAEWGRRDPEAALAHVGREWVGAHSQDYTHAQAAFSVFRGWASQDPESALLALEAYLPKPGGTLPRHGYELDSRTYDLCRSAIFRELAVESPAHAWNLAAGHDGLQNHGTVTGIFSGILDPDTLRHFLDRWTDAVWDTPTAREGVDGYNRALQSSFTGFIKMPEAERIVRDAARTYAEVSPEAALLWLEEIQHSETSAHLGRAYDLLRDWAADHPDTALEALRSDRFPEHTRAIAIGMLATVPQRGTEVLELLPDDRRLDYARELPAAMGSHDVRDFFPAPWKNNRLRDFAADYRATLATLESVQATPDMFQRVHLEFSAKVPEAAAQLGDR